MSANYKCPECGEVSTEAAWNRATEAHFGKGITEIADGDANTATFICPACDCDICGDAADSVDTQLTVKIKRLHPDAAIPKYARVGDSGFDLVSTADVIVEPGGTVLVPTGISVELPPGYEIQVRPRSGVSLRTKLRVANAPGTVDNSFRGEVGVIIDNIAQYAYDGISEEGPVVFTGHPAQYISGEEAYDRGYDYVSGTYIIRKGDRIAQGIIQRVETVTFVEVAATESLSETERGSGGFGHSGVTN